MSPRSSTIVDAVATHMAAMSSGAAYIGNLTKRVAAVYAAGAKKSPNPGRNLEPTSKHNPATRDRWQPGRFQLLTRILGNLCRRGLPVRFMEPIRCAERRVQPLDSRALTLSSKQRSEWREVPRSRCQRRRIAVGRAWPRRLCQRMEW